MNTIIPDFQLDEATHTGTVVLKVANLEKMTLFYQSTIGLQIKSQTDNQTVFGVPDSKALLILHKIEQPLPLTKRTGLFHVAFLLPSRKDLGNALIHYVQEQAPLGGASDHGYSEALYLTDPEGNGIEVYHDKPMSEWDIREDGEIPGITIEMDAQSVIAAADGQWTGFPAGTKVGHVHLKVADLQKTEYFYTEILGLTLKSNFHGQAKFFATGKYHHHIGSNIWLGEHVPPMDERDLGLEYYVFFVPHKEELERIQAHWETKAVNYQVAPDGALFINDPNGIAIRFEIE